MDINLIKKELYKQKVDANFQLQSAGHKIYAAKLFIEGEDEIIEFRIPLKKCEFEEVVPAQLLIRWINI